MPLTTEKILVHDRIFQKFIDREQISDVVMQMGKKISADYNDKNLVFVIALKGAVLFAADLARAVDIPLEIEFIRASSYGKSLESSGNVTLDISTLNIQDKDVLIIEDIVDTGLTMEAVIKGFQKLSPNSIRIATLLFKREMLKVNIEPEYVGFTIPSKFVVGYGLDYAEKGRNLADIYILDEH